MMRDSRLDLWRGLCLLDMVLVHLAYEGIDFGPVAGPILLEWTRFAAGGFVFVAGAGVALVFGPKAATPSTRAETHGALGRRAAYLLGVHYAATAAFLALLVLRDAQPAPADSGATLGDVLLLREVPHYADVLPLYVAMLLLSPALLAALRRGVAWLLAAVSALLFAAGQLAPFALSPRDGETFPILLWQSVFVAGLLFGHLFPRFDRATSRTRARLLFAAWFAAGAVVLASPAGARLLGVAMPDLGFRKVPLGPGEWFRYVTLTVAILLSTAALWPRIASARTTPFVLTLGRRSLAVYVAHVFVQAGVISLAALAPRPAGPGFALLALLLLFGIARAIDGWERGMAGRALRLRLVLRGLAAPPLGVAAVVAALLLLPGADGGPDPGSMAAVEPESPGATVEAWPARDDEVEAVAAPSIPPPLAARPLAVADTPLVDEAPELSPDGDELPFEPAD